jgi:hypothetical protein
MKYHHFRRYVEMGDIMIHAIDMKGQPADIFMKPLEVETFQKHRRQIMGW